MRIPSAEASVSQTLLNKVENLAQGENHWAKRHVLSRAVSLVATPVFAALDLVYNAVSACVKLPFAIFKGTIGKIPFPKFGKLEDKMSNQLGMGEVLRHALKVGAYALQGTVGTVVGLVSPKHEVALAAKLGILPQLPVIAETTISDEPAVNVTEEDNTPSTGNATQEDLLRREAEELRLAEDAVRILLERQQEIDNAVSADSSDSHVKGFGERALEAVINTTVDIVDYTILQPARQLGITFG